MDLTDYVGFYLIPVGKVLHLEGIYPNSDVNYATLSQNLSAVVVKD